MSAGFSEARVAEVMRRQRCDWATACVIMGTWGARRRNARRTRAQREEAALTRLRSSHAWKRDFEL